MSAGHGATLRGVRTIPTFVVSITVLLAASALVMSPAGAAGLPRGGVIEVTGYKLVAVVDSSGPVTAEAKGEEAKAIRIALSNYQQLRHCPCALMSRTHSQSDSSLMPVRTSVLPILPSQEAVRLPVL